MANKEVKVKVSAIDAASASLKKIGVEAENLGGQGQKFKVNWQQAGAAMTVAGGAIVGGFVASAKAAGDYGGQIFDATRKTGMSAESLTALKFAAEQSGVGFDMLQGAIAKQARTANEAATGNKTAQEAYARLGVSVTDASGKMKDGNTLLLETADALKGIENPTQRSALAMEIFGRSGSQMLPMLMEGSAGIAELEAKAKSLGLTMTDEMAKAADDAGDRMEAAQASIGMAWKNIGATVLPVVADVADKIAVVAGNVSRWAQDNPGLAKSLGTVALGIGAVMTAVGPLLIALPTLKSGFELLQLVKTAGGLNAVAAGFDLTGIAALKASPRVQAFGAALKVAGIAASAYAAAAALASQGEKMYEGAKGKQGFGAGVKRVAGKALGGTIGGNIAKLVGGKKLTAADLIPILAAFEGRASGGPVTASKPVMVGENGPEVFVPKTAGEIKTQAQFAQLMSGFAAAAGGKQKSAQRVASEKRAAAEAAAKAKRRAEREKYMAENYGGREAEQASLATMTRGLFAAMGGPERKEKKRQVTGVQVDPELRALWMAARDKPNLTQEELQRRRDAEEKKQLQGMLTGFITSSPAGVSRSESALTEVGTQAQSLRGIMGGFVQAVNKPQAMMPTGSRTVQAAQQAAAAGYNAPRQRATGGGDSIVIDLRLADGMIANVARQVLSSRDGRDIIIRTVKAQGARTVPQVAFGGYG